MTIPLQVLVLEDRKADAELAVREMEQAGFTVTWQRVDTLRDFRLRLTPNLDLILADYSLPGFTVVDALGMLKESRIDVPILVVSGSVGDEQGVECLKLGATDYILKDRMARLGPAAHRALHERNMRREKLLALASMERSEEQTRTVLATIEDVVWSLSIPDGKVTYLNPAAEKMFGRPATEFLANGKLWLESVHPEDREAMVKLQKSMIQWGTGEGPMRILRPDGSIRHVLTRAWCAYAPDGKPLRLEGICTDLTEKLVAEENLRHEKAALEEAQSLAHLGSWEYDIKDDRATLSEEGWRIWGVRPKTQASTDYFMAQVQGDDKLRFQASLNDAIEKGLDYDLVVAIKTPTGPRHTRHRGRVATRDANRKPTVLHGTIQDVTDEVLAQTQRHQLEAARAEASRLAELGEFKSRFIGMVAHDLNNVLTPMRINAHLVSDQLVEAGKEESKPLQALGRSITRLEGFLGDLLDASRLQSGHLVLDSKLFDGAASLAESLDAIKPLAGPQGITVVRQLPAALLLNGDRRRLEQVTMNLLSNALKFTPPGGQILVTLGVGPDGVLLSVTDSGRGIAAEDIGNLFQPFSRLGAAPQGKHTGTGLGLFICKGIVEQHGGRIWCESPGLDRGATFQVLLPAGPLVGGP